MTSSANGTVSATGYQIQNLMKRVTELEELCSIGRYHLMWFSKAEHLANEIYDFKPEIFTKHEIHWGTFDDGTDDIKIKDMNSKTPNPFAGKRCIFIASFDNNANTMSQLHLISYLCELRPYSLTIVLPFFPTGTSERISYNHEGEVPTANTLALIFNGMPSPGIQTRIMTYDIHALQEQFYFANHANATLHTAIPSLLDAIKETDITNVVFPDDGAKKRFGDMFPNVDDESLSENGGKKYSIIVCSKQHIQAKESEGGYQKDRQVVISEGRFIGDHAIIVDDQTKSGGTLFECAHAIKKQTATDERPNGVKISIYVTHPVFSPKFWENVESQTKDIDIGKFYFTNSIPGREIKFRTSFLHKKYQQISLAPLIVKDLLS
jgi:phosphoribosylpyrophosphate synthetase